MTSADTRTPRGHRERVGKAHQTGKWLECVLSTRASVGYKKGSLASGGLLVTADVPQTETHQALKARTKTWLPRWPHVRTLQGNDQQMRERRREPLQASRPPRGKKATEQRGVGTSGQSNVSTEEPFLTWGGHWTRGSWFQAIYFSKQPPKLGLLCSLFLVPVWFHKLVPGCVFNTSLARVLGLSAGDDLHHKRSDLLSPPLELAFPQRPQRVPKESSLGFRSEGTLEWQCFRDGVSDPQTGRRTL